MKKISDVRKSLADIPDCQIDFKPEEDFIGGQEGVQTIWSGETAIGSEDKGSLESANEIEQQRPHTESERSHFPPPEPVFEFGAEIDDKSHILNGDEGERIRKSVLAKGIEALAAYLSFHVSGAQWGIYIPTSSIAYMVTRVFHRVEGSLETKCRLAFYTLLEHELFHFATDYMVAQWEMIWHDVIWAAMRARTKQQATGYWEREEKLANAYMLRRLRFVARSGKAKGLLKEIKAFTAQQPPGYCDGERVRTNEWDEELKFLAKDYMTSAKFHNEVHDIFLSHIDFTAFFPLTPRIDWRYCPIHLIHDEHRLVIPKINVDLFASLTGLEEAPSFLRLLHRLPDQTQRKWGKFKRLSSSAVTRGMDLKRWRSGGEDVWTARIDDNYRVHMQFISREQKWLALKIGNHSEMGHG